MWYIHSENLYDKRYLLLTIFGQPQLHSIWLGDVFIRQSSAQLARSSSIVIHGLGDKQQKSQRLLYRPSSC